MAIFSKGKFWALIIALVVFAVRFYVPTFPFPDADLTAWLNTAIVAILALFGIVVDQSLALAKYRRDIDDVKIEHQKLVKQLERENKIK